eukprot:2059216-Prymnesium_polylepis.1
MASLRSFHLPNSEWALRGIGVKANGELRSAEQILHVPEATLADIEVACAARPTCPAGPAGPAGPSRPAGPLAPLALLPRWPSCPAGPLALPALCDRARVRTPLAPLRAHPSRPT